MNNTDKESITMEKIIIVYLAIITIILLFIAIFFICYIEDRGTINSIQTTAITYPDNDIEQIDNGDEENNKNNYNNNNKRNIVEKDAIFKIFEGTKEWKEIKELDIFSGEHTHVAKDKIAPGVQDTYTYTVECQGNSNMMYNMQFSDVNPYNVNMIFKLKRNGQYVAGDEKTWVKVEQLSQTDMTIVPGTIDVFTLEWRWEHSENDTEVGKIQGSNYKILIDSYAEAIIDN